MPRRNLLSSEQRIRLFAIPTDPVEMARHYVLSSGDLAFIRTKRRPINRLGFAIQLCLLRHPGQGMGRTGRASSPGNDSLHGASARAVIRQSR
jgi:TnpA family transposase